jgi:preprotein translocase subunit SecG
MFTIAINILLVIHVLVSLLIVFVVLMQRPKNEGLGAAFGGGMTENLFGAQTTNVLQTFTRYLGGIFFALTLLLSWLYVKQTSERTTIQQRLTAPLATPKPTSIPAVASPAPGAKTPEKPASPADEKKPGTASPAPAKPAASTPAPAAAEKPAAEKKPAPATPASEPPKPAAPAAATPAPADKPGK